MQSRNGRARDAYLDGLPAEQHAETLRQAERLGVRPDDPDWIIARAAQEAAEKIEALIAAVPVADLSARLDRIESRVEQMPSARMLEPLFVRADPEPSLAGAIRDLTAFAFALLVSIAVVIVAVNPQLRSPVALVAAFALGVCCAFGYLWGEPIVSQFIERRQRQRR